MSNEGRKDYSFRPFVMRHFAVVTRNLAQDTNFTFMYQKMLKNFVEITKVTLVLQIDYR